MSLSKNNPTGHWAITRGEIKKLRNEVKTQRKNSNRNWSRLKSENEKEERRRTKKWIITKITGGKIKKFRNKVLTQRKNSNGNWSRLKSENEKEEEKNMNNHKMLGIKQRVLGVRDIAGKIDTITEEQVLYFRISQCRLTDTRYNT